MSKKSKKMHKHGIKHIEEEVEAIEKDVKKIEKDISVFAKFENVIFEIIIILIFGIALGALAGYMVGATQPIVIEATQQEGVVATAPEGLAQKIQDYVNVNLIMDDSVTVNVTDSGRDPRNVYEYKYEISQDGMVMEEGSFLSTGNNLIIGTEFNLDEPLMTFDDEPNQLPPAELELTDEEIIEILMFNNCLAEQGIVIYGANWCGWTSNIVENLGGYSLVGEIYVECTENEELCNEEGITGYPTIKRNGEIVNPDRSFAGFAQITGCTSPQFAQRIEAQASEGSC